MTELLISLGFPARRGAGRQPWARGRCTHCSGAGLQRERRSGEPGLLSLGLLSLGHRQL